MTDDEMIAFKSMVRALSRIRETYSYSRSAFEKPDEGLTPTGISIRDSWREVNQALDSAFTVFNQMSDAERNRLGSLEVES